MNRNSPFGVGRLMRAAICGLLAAIAIPAAASAQLGGVTVTPPSTPAPVPTVTAPTVSVPTVTASVPAAPTASASSSASTPVASASVSASTQPSVRASASPGQRPAKPKRSSGKGKKGKKGKKGTATPQDGANVVGAQVRTLMQASTTTAPFAGPVTNTCVTPAESVALNAHVKTTVIEQQDGTIGTLISMGGTGLTLTGVKYSFSDESRLYILGGPGDAENSFYHYQKLVRTGETGTSTLGGDDFYLRVFMRFPPGTSGVPSDDSLNTNTMGFDCR